MHGTRSVLVFSLVLLALCGTGCSSFEDRWAEQLDRPPANGLAGLWEGTWLSDVNAHTGGLRAIVEKSSDGRYHAYYRATYTLVFCDVTFEYDLPMDVTEEDGAYRFRGEADLGSPRKR